MNTNCDAFFQKPRTCSLVEQQEIWYTGRKVGINTISNMMKVISAKAQLSQVYTNHCIRATTSTILSHANLNENDIIAVTGYKDPKSLLPYVASTSNEKRKNMSGILHGYGKSQSIFVPQTSTVSVPPSENAEIPSMSAQEPLSLPIPPNCYIAGSLEIVPKTKNELSNVCVNSQQSNKIMAQELATRVFQGNNISGGQFTVNFNFSN